VGSGALPVPWPAANVLPDQLASLFLTALPLRGMTESCSPQSIETAEVEHVAETVAAVAAVETDKLGVVACLPPLGLANEQGGGKTPETGTPPARSPSPSSDGDSAPAVTVGESAGAHVSTQAVPDAAPVPVAMMAPPAPLPPSAGNGVIRRTREDTRRDKRKNDRAGGRGGGGANRSNDGTLVMAPPAPYPVMLPPPITANAPPSNSMSDRRIIEALAAPDATHRRLLWTARRLPEIVQDAAEPSLANCVELYGSLSLDMMQPPSCWSWKQDWESYYVNSKSDVDFVVEMKKKVPPTTVAQRVLKSGPWKLVSQVAVHKFGSTQFTLLGTFGKEGDENGASEVYLDITCIEQPLHFERFKSRQKAFQTVFVDARSGIEAQFAAQGALAFDAYIHLLKAFAAKVPGNGLTGFQATCIGLFTLKIGHFRLKSTQSIALSLFEGFLRFCFSFYGDAPPLPGSYWYSIGYRQCAIDLTSGGRWLPRMSTSWRSELYLMAAEAELHTRSDEHMNVTHSLDPCRVSAEALALLKRAFSGTADCEGGFSFLGAVPPAPATVAPPSRP